MLVYNSFSSFLAVFSCDFSKNRRATITNNQESKITTGQLSNIRIEEVYIIQLIEVNKHGILTGSHLP